MRCDEIKKRIMTYIDGKLAPGEVVKFESHLGACPMCRAGYAEEVELVAAFRTDVSGVSGDRFLDRVMSRVEAAAPGRAPAGGNGFQLRLWPMAAAAAVLFAVAAFGLLDIGVDAAAGESEIQRLIADSGAIVEGVLESAEGMLDEFYRTGSTVYSDTQTAVSTATAPYSAMIGAATALASALCALLVFRTRKRIAREVVRT